MVDWSSDSGGGDKFDWETDGEAEPLSASALSDLDASGLSTQDAKGWASGEAPSSSLIEEYVGKGFPKEMVLKATKAIGNNDANALHELLLTYKVLGDCPLLGNCSSSGCTPHNDETMVDWSSDSDDGDKFDWESDGEAEPLSALALTNLDVPGPSTLDANGWAPGEAPSSSLVEEYVGKGFPKEMVLKAIKAIGNNDANALRELLLVYKVLGDYPFVGICSSSGCTPQNDETMVDWSSDSDDGDKFDWESDGEDGLLSALALTNFDVPGSSRVDSSVSAPGEAPSSSLVDEYVGKGFPKEMVLKAIKAIGNNDANALRELLLAYKVQGDYPLAGNCSSSACTPHNVDDDDDDDLDFENWDDDDDLAGEREASSDGSIAEDFKQEILEKDKKIKSLVGVGFLEDEANMTINRCGVGASFFVLDDSKNLPNHEVTNTSFESFGGRKKAGSRKESKKKRKRYGGREKLNELPMDDIHDEPMAFPKKMVGFNLPDGMVRSVNRRLPKQSIGPPFFYYENVAQAPKGAWRTISRNLYGVEAEFVDSKYFCAAARKRGYIHNLPIENREPLLPVPPKTIFGAFPHYSEWWPSWDSRRQLNCLPSCVPSSKLTEWIECVLARADNPPSLTVQKSVMDECRRFNFVWVGKGKVAALDPHEMEYLLGFPKDHTRGLGITERFKSLGNSFQVDTIAYHLSVLRDMFPNGIKVLSLFTGIGGAEVALHRLGIHLRVVVSVEISEPNRRIFKGWWNQTQTGQLVEYQDVKTLTNEKVKSLTREFGGFDLVIGGSPCNNLAGRNRFHRDGLEGKQSALFFHYSRILDAVKSVMERM